MKKSVLLVGRSGSGKGKQGPRLAQFLDFSYWSSGDELRERNRKHQLSHAKAGQLDAGMLLEDRTMFHLFLDVIQKNPGKLAPHKGWILDGYPRTRYQAQMLIPLLEGLERGSLHAIELEVSREVCLERLKARAAEEGRLDDKAEAAIARRQDFYESETIHMLAHLKELHKHMHVVRISGMGTPDEVAARLQETAMAMGIMRQKTAS